MESIIDVSGLKQMDNNQSFTINESSVLDYIDEEQNESSNSPSIFWALTSAITNKLKKIISKMFCMQSDAHLTVGERLLQGEWFPGFNICLFYLCLFFGFCAIVNFLIDTNEMGWIYTLFFFTFFISSIIG